MSVPAPNSRTAHLFEDLGRHRTNLLKTVEGIPRELRSQRPSPDRWSVLEILEHLGLVERRLTFLFQQWVAEARAQGLPPEDPAIPPVDLKIVLDRGYQVAASDAVRPKGGQDEAAVRTALEEAREALKDTLLALQDLPLGGIVRPHPALGPLHFYQWVEFVGWHEARHTAQISENGALLAGALG